MPLRVSMFCESDVPSIRAMMGLLQEHGELIVCCGSSLNMHNMGVFDSADMAVSVGPDAPSRETVNAPLPRRRRGVNNVSSLPSKSAAEYSTETRLASTFTSIPCTLNLRQGTPMSQLIKIISTSRVLLDAMRQSLVFALDASLLLMFTALFGNCLLIPSPLDTSQIIFELLCVVPVLMAAVMLSGMRVQRRVPEAHPMKMKLTKGNKAKMPRADMRYVIGVPRRTFRALSVL